MLLRDLLMICILVSDILLLLLLMMVLLLNHHLLLLLWRRLLLLLWVIHLLRIHRLPLLRHILLLLRILHGIVLLKVLLELWLSGSLLRCLLRSLLLHWGRRLLLYSLLLMLYSRRPLPDYLLLLKLPLALFWRRSGGLVHVDLHVSLLIGHALYHTAALRLLSLLFACLLCLLPLQLCDLLILLFEILPCDACTIQLLLGLFYLFCKRLFRNLVCLHLGLQICALQHSLILFR